MTQQDHTTAGLPLVSTPGAARPWDREKYTVAGYLDLLRAKLLPHFPAAAHQTLPLQAAVGRTLAEPVRARCDVPVFDNSAMDGYAVRWADIATASLPASLTLAGDVPAGSTHADVVEPGTCVRIMTGAPMPPGADSVVPVELTDAGADGDAVRINELPRQGAGANVRRRGEDVTCDDVLAQVGDVITPGHCSAFAGCGVADVAVRRRLRVAVAATGDELVRPPADLGPGQIFESNAVTLAAVLESLGCEVTVLPVTEDTELSFTTSLELAAIVTDVIMTTGGVSVGDHDISRDVLIDKADGRFVHVSMQPGKPQGFAIWNRTPVLAFPGNPLSAIVSCLAFFAPLHREWLGNPAATPRHAMAGAGWKTPPGRTQFIPVALNTSDLGQLLATPTHLRHSASHMVTSVARAQALAVVDADLPAVAPGDIVEILPIPGGTW